MKKLLLAVFFLMAASWARAQVSSVTILGNPVSATEGGSIAVTFVINDDGLVGLISYDILFSGVTAVSDAAYSSFLKKDMVCANTDSGFSILNGGSAANTIIQTVTVPAASYSGFIVVTAVKNAAFLSCSDPAGSSAFTINGIPTATFTNTATSTATKTATNTATVTNTFTVTNTATITPTPTNTFTATVTPTFTNTSTSTNTATSTATKTATNTATNTLTVTPTSTNGFFKNAFGDSLPGTILGAAVAAVNPQGTVVFFKVDSNGNLLTNGSGGAVTLGSSVTVAKEPDNMTTPMAAVSANSGAISTQLNSVIGNNGGSAPASLVAVYFPPTNTPTSYPAGTNTPTPVFTATPPGNYVYAVVTWVITPNAGHIFTATTTNFTNVYWEVAWTGIGGASTSFTIRELYPGPFSNDLNTQGQTVFAANATGNWFGNFTSTTVGQGPVSAFSIVSNANITPTPGAAWTFYGTFWNVRSAFYREHELHIGNPDYNGIFICQTRRSSFDPWSCPKIINKNEWPWWKWIVVRYSGKG